jgi:hypothetical protein
MSKAKQLGMLAAAGLLAGLVFLGVGGRLAMRIIVLAHGDTPGFSISGTLQVLGVGAVIGGLGSVASLVLQRIWRRASWMRGVALGSAMFAVGTAIFVPTAAGIDANFFEGLFIAALFAAIFFGYGLTMEYTVQSLLETNKEQIEVYSIKGGHG